jgi:hypothetical protein
MSLRTLSELINTDDSALPIVEALAAKVPGRCLVLPPSADCGEVLVRTQITTRSPMGAIVYHTGGILVDSWLRILGSGSPQIRRNLPDWNEGRSNGFYLIADDVVGGFFAIDGGSLGLGNRQVAYWSPDSLEWLNLQFGYTDFLAWAMTENTETFYADLRWQNWKEEVASLSGDQCFAFYPFLWTREGSIATSRRAEVPIQELFDLKADVCRQLAGP